MNKIISLIVLTVTLSSCNIWMNCNCVMKYKTIENRAKGFYNNPDIIGLYEFYLEKINNPDSMNYRINDIGTKDSVQHIFLELGENGYAAYTTSNYRNKIINRHKKQNRYHKKCGTYKVNSRDISITLASKNSNDSVTLNGQFDYSRHSILIREIIYRPEEKNCHQPVSLIPSEVFMINNDQLIFRKKETGTIKNYYNNIDYSRKQKNKK